jgi:hypothetical protein
MYYLYLSCSCSAVMNRQRLSPRYPQTPQTSCGYQRQEKGQTRLHSCLTTLGSALEKAQKSFFAQFLAFFPS